MCTYIEDAACSAVCVVLGGRTVVSINIGKNSNRTLACMLPWGQAALCYAVWQHEPIYTINRTSASILFVCARVIGYVFSWLLLPLLMHSCSIGFRGAIHQQCQHQEIFQQKYFKYFSLSLSDYIAVLNFCVLDGRGR